MGMVELLVNMSVFVPSRLSTPWPHITFFKLKELELICDLSAVKLVLSRFC